MPVTFFNDIHDTAQILYESYCCNSIMLPIVIFAANIYICKLHKYNYILIQLNCFIARVADQNLVTIVRNRHQQASTAWAAIILEIHVLILYP